MRGKLILGNFDEYESTKYNISEGLDPYDYEISICTDLSEEFVNLILNIGEGNESDLNASIEAVIDCCEDEESMTFFKQYRNRTLELLQNAEYVTFNFDVEKICEYVKANKILRTKKIIFNDILELKAEIVTEISNTFGNDTSNIYFNVVGNNKLISFEEYKATVKVIDDIVKDIEKFNFSPMEKIMYVYDIVRDKVYVEVDENEDKNISRSLSSALLGNKIVCVGYAKIFRTILEKLGISSHEVYLYYPNKNGGHARNEVYIKDEKYAVDGVYYFDPTWDSKESENDNSYLFSYRYFAMTKPAMDLMDKGRLIDRVFPCFSDDIAYKFEEIIKEGLEKVPEEMIKSINYMSSLVYNKQLIDKFRLILYRQGITKSLLEVDTDKVIEELIPLVEYFNKPLSANILLKVLYNVRKQQYYTNPEKYPFGLNEFYKTIIESRWCFEMTGMQKLAYEIAKPKEKGRIISNQIVEYSQNTDLYRDIERVKFAKTLRRIYNNKKDNEK